MNLTIAIPLADDEIKVGCFSSMILLWEELRSRGHTLKLMTNRSADPFSARNIMASLALYDKTASHLLFVDSDMMFQPSAVLRLIEARKPLIGCIYPRRHLDLPMMWASSISSLRMATAAASRFVVGRRERRTEENGLLQVDGLGMGLCLIERSVFESLAAHSGVRRGPPNEYSRAVGLDDTVYGFFDPLIKPDGQWTSEDFSFCIRWSSLCGGEVWALTDADVGHIGEMIYSAKFSDRPK